MQADLQQRNVPFKVFKVDFKDVDRAILDGAGGFVKILTAEKKDSILGATIVGPDAGNMISEVTVAMQAGLGLGALASVIHPYPTQVMLPSARNSRNACALLPHMRWLHHMKSTMGESMAHL
jgi:pyruvate/2-oxoglutarate dehydrogenase complex dihydrolipoamide dehydrogenase (E3) component